MEFKIYQTGSYHIIEIKEVLHLTTILTDLQVEVNNLLKKGINLIAIQFANDSYLCSQTGATIVHCWEAIKEENGELALVNTNEDILDFLKIIDIDKLIKVYLTTDDLIHNFAYQK